MTSILYGNLSDDDLAAKIVELTASYEKTMTGGAAIVVAGQGRRIEYTRSNSSGLMALLTAATREQQRRAGIQVDGALSITFPYGGDCNNG
jgi:peptidoglycan hydrolase-like protein with peptidoglycan-binding domain